MGILIVVDMEECEFDESIVFMLREVKNIREQIKAEQIICGQ